MEIKEVREGRATYYLVPFEFLDREYRFFEFTFTPEGPIRVTTTSSKPNCGAKSESLSSRIE